MIPGTQHLDPTPVPGCGLRMYCSKHERCVRPVELIVDDDIYLVCRQCLDEEASPAITLDGGSEAAASHGMFGWWEKSLGNDYFCHYCNNGYVLQCIKCSKQVCMRHAASNSALCWVCEGTKATVVIEADDAPVCTYPGCKTKDVSICSSCDKPYCRAHAGWSDGGYMLCDFCTKGEVYCG